MSAPADPDALDREAFRKHGYALIDWIASYLEDVEKRPVLARVAPGDITRALPTRAPDKPESFHDILADFGHVLAPGLTHWNHPGFFAYFATSASKPGILGELLSAALNQQAMLWRTSPAATELEAVTLSWLRQLMGLPEAFDGVIYDTASISTLHAFAAAREALVPAVREHGLAGRPDLEPCVVYCSEHTHSSIDKSVILLGLGHDAVRRVAANPDFEMRPDALDAAIVRDRVDGKRPIAVVATIGTTSTASVDPVAAIGEIARAHGLWLHVDAAYGGAAALVPDCEPLFRGCEHADSLVVNPHKWLFTPFDLSVLYCRRMDVLRAAFSLVPDYLRTPEEGAAHNLMDTGIQLGRRFRSLKFWMILRSFGADRLRHLIAEHIRLARLFASWVDADPGFERVAPVRLSVVCFRARPASAGDDPRALDGCNERLLERVNATGEVFLSHTRLQGRYVIRLAIGHLRTTEAHVSRAWEILHREAMAL